jgi:23S rRNA (pseudouridine1915-N3)-methyltransferase
VKLYLYYIGKARDGHANAMAEEYIKRSTRFAKCEMREIHPGRFDPWAKNPASLIVLLDPAGRALDSMGFTALVSKAEQDARDVVFILGGSDGLPADWRKRASLLVSLTPLTMPHELARVVVAEQIYRALTTMRGHPYPR